MPEDGGMHGAATVPRVAVLCHDLSSNALGRAYVLAMACPPSWDVAIWGPQSRDRAWQPLADDRRFPLRRLPSDAWPPRKEQMRRWARDLAAGSDVVVASKPLPTSYGVARELRERTGRAFVLDVDDWELGFRLAGGVQWKIVLDGLRQWRNPFSYFPTKRLDSLAQHEPHVTVSNEFLRARFGGVVVPHARDESVFDPSRWDVGVIRKRHGLDDRRVVLFFGTPRPHKGVEDLVDAVAGIADASVVCVIAGANDGDPFVASLRARGGSRVRTLPELAFDRIPEVVSMADVVVVPQRGGIGTRGQFPAKIVDAMAMAKPIIGTQVEEIPAALRDGAGLVVPPGDVESLRRAIQEVLEDPPKAVEMGRRARARFEQEFSLAVARRRLRPVLDAALADQDTRRR